MRKSRVGFFVGVGISVAASGFIFEVASVTPLHAQTTIDAAKVTCDELTSARAGPPRTIIAWISGYLGAKRDSTVIDPRALRNQVRELQRYCYQQKNFKVPVMKAIEELFGDKK
jgi:HdeA/HdeB family